MIKKVISKVNFYQIGMILGGGILVYQIIKALLYWRQNFLSIPSSGFLLIALLTAVFSILLQMITWRIILKGLGYVVPYAVIFKGFALSFLPRYIPGTVWGYLSRGEWFFREYGIPRMITNIGSIQEVVVVLVSAVILLAIEDFPSSNFIFQLTWSILILALPILSWLLFDRLARISFISKVIKIDQSLSSSKSFIIHWHQAIFIYIFQWVILGGVVFATQAAFTGNAWNETIHRLALSARSFSIAWVMGFLVVFVPGGLGIRELVLTNMLTINLGLPIELSGVISIISRFWLLAGEIFWVISGFFIKNKRQQVS